MKIIAERPLAVQFRIASLAILLLGMLIIGSWTGMQIERGVINRTAAVTALYVDSFISPHLQSLAGTGALTDTDLHQLEKLLTETPLGQEIVSFKVWAPDGTIIYSPNQDLIGRRFPVRANLQQAFEGSLRAEISDLDDEEQVYERSLWDRLIETYTPARAAGSGQVIAVSEFYQLPGPLLEEVEEARRLSWFVVGGAGILMYLALSGMVGRASRTIENQRSELERQVDLLGKLLSQNQELHRRVQRAAARTTALNERFLRRVASDLHDGPGQDIAFALLRLDDIRRACQPSQKEGEQDSGAFQALKSALESALGEIRATSSGLRLPEIEDASPEEIILRARQDYQGKTQCEVQVELGELPDRVPLPIQITLYRLIQEALANGYRHAAGAGQVIRAGQRAGHLLVEIADAGGGFDPSLATAAGNLGLLGMRERVEILGGQYEIASPLDRGTTIRATLPLDVSEAADE